MDGKSIVGVIVPPKALDNAVAPVAIPGSVLSHLAQAGVSTHAICHSDD